MVEEEVVQREPTVDDTKYVVGDLYKHSMELFEMPGYRLQLAMEYHNKVDNDLITISEVRVMIESYLNHKSGG